MKRFIENTTKTFDATPSYKLLDTMGFGSYNIQTAVADIVDNSITAGASLIDIDFVWDEENAYVEIIDNGCGMSSDELVNAMRFSGKGIHDDRSENDLGKYGLGMKTASMYACKCLTVISKKDGYPITAKRLDRDTVNEAEAWLGIDLDDSEQVKKKHLERGTIVRWDKLSFTEEGKDSKNYFLKYVRDVDEHIQLIFHRFLEKGNLTIKINGRSIEPWNPICPHPATTKFDSQILQYKGYDIGVNTYLLPSSLSCTEDEIQEIYRGNAMELQGFFVYRNERLLIDGGWLDIQKGSQKLSTHQAYNSVRIIIDISSELDSLLKVDFTKSSLKFPIEVEEQLCKIAMKARKKAKELSKSRTYTPLTPGEKVVEIWKTKQKGNDYTFTINKTHPLIKRLTKDMDKEDFKELMSLLSKTVPVVGSERKFTGTFTDEDIDILIQSQYIKELQKNKVPEVIYKEMIKMEPFNMYKELVNAFFEKLKEDNAE